MRSSSSTSPLTAMFDEWSRPSYEVRVRDLQMILLIPRIPLLGGHGRQRLPWGSGNIATPIPLTKPLLLHIRNDPFGDPDDFWHIGRHTGRADPHTLNPAASTQTKLGILE